MNKFILAGTVFALGAMAFTGQTYAADASESAVQLNMSVETIVKLNCEAAAPAGADSSVVTMGSIIGYGKSALDNNGITCGVDSSHDYELTATTAAGGFANTADNTDIIPAMPSGQWENNRTGWAIREVNTFDNLSYNGNNWLSLPPQTAKTLVDNGADTGIRTDNTGKTQEYNFQVGAEIADTDSRTGDYATELTFTLTTL